MLDLEGLVGLHRAVQLQLLQHYWLGSKLYNATTTVIIEVLVADRDAV